MMLVASRTHYSIDIVGGIIFGVFSYDISTYFVYYSDSLFALPHLLYRKIRDKLCSPSKQTDYNNLSDDI